MNPLAAVNTLIDVVAEELYRDENRVFLTELLRNGFVGFAKMSDKRLQQELEFRGIENQFLIETDDEDLELQEEFATSIADLRLQVSEYHSN